MLDRSILVLAAAGLTTLAAADLLRPGAAGAVDAWPKRMFDAQNTTNVGVDPKLTPENVVDLAVETRIVVSGGVNATPIVSEDRLLFIGDGGGNGGYFYVIDLDTGARLVQLFTNATVSTPLIGNGMQSTALLAEVTVPDGSGGTVEEKRVYFGANVKPKSFWCLSVSRILADRSTLAEAGEPSDGSAYLCDGSDWPILIAGVGDVSQNALTAPLPVYNASPVFAKDREVVDASGERTVRDVVYTPTIGADCSDGQLWAIDAVTAEVLWIYDPVPNFQNLHPAAADAVGGVLGDPRVAQAPAAPGYGGVIWTVPAASADGKYLFVTTGDCVEQPQVGFQAESLVALDAATGEVVWYHQRRLVDVSDYDIGNSPLVVDVEGPDGCHNIVSTDKNGCIYGFRQERDIPIVGELGFDELRVGQQRVLWRQCFVPGSLNGGFNCATASLDGRVVVAQAAGLVGRVPGDDANAFALDACTGEFLWASAAVGSGRNEGAVASGMWFQASGRRLDVFRMGPSEDLLATVQLPASSSGGGGGPAIVDGKIYVPISNGVAIVSVQEGSGASPPAPRAVSFGGPYPLPLGTAGEQPVMPIDPYDPASAPAGPVETWPSMNPTLGWD